MLKYIISCRGSSVVERRPEEAGVVGSSPTFGICTYILDAKVDQLVDRLVANEKVAGSSPVFRL